MAKIPDDIQSKIDLAGQLMHDLILPFMQDKLARLEAAEKVCEWHSGEGVTHPVYCKCEGCELLNAWIALKEQSNADPD